MNFLKKHSYFVAFVLLLFVPLLTNNYSQYLVNLILVYILVTLGFNLLVGYVGRFSFGNAAFFGIGAYSVGLLMRSLNMPFWFSLPIAGLISAIVGLLVGLPALRLHRYYLAIVTLAFTNLMKFVYIHGGTFTYGPSGFDIPNPTIFGFSFSDDKRVSYIVLVVFFLMLFLVRNLTKSRIGRALSATKGGENAAEALSIDTKKAVLLAFTMSGFVVGVSGGLFCIVMKRITPDCFGMSELLRHFIMVVLGGLGSITGSMIGATIIILLPEFLRSIQGIQEMVFGLLIVVFVLFAPQGLYGFILKVIPGISREKLYQDG